MRKTTIGVLRGGPSSEYEVSLKTGGSVLRHLPREKYRALDILVDKKGVWHAGGIPSTPDRILRGVDAVFCAMHGEFGEDGKAQRILEMYGVPFTGSASWPSFLAMHKPMAKGSFAEAGLKNPGFALARKEDRLEDIAAEAVRKIGPPWIVKPARRGSSLGVYPASDYRGLCEAVQKSLEWDNSVLIEKRITGREATCAVLEDFRGEEYYTLPVVEIVPPEGKDFFAYEVKYDGSTQEICPGRFSPEEKKQIKDMAIRAHRALGCRHYSRSDFIVARDGAHILETNTLPGLTSESLLPKAAASVGLDFPGLLDHLINLAKNR